MHSHTLAVPGLFFVVANVLNMVLGGTVRYDRSEL